MSTDYFNRLDPSTQKWYKEKLEIIGNIGPYSVPDSHFSVKFGDFPPICYPDSQLSSARVHLPLMTWGLIRASKLTIRLLKAGSEMWRLWLTSSSTSSWNTPETLNHIYLFHDGGRYHIETSPLIYLANQWTGFYMITASVMEELNTNTGYLYILTIFYT